MHGLTYEQAEDLFDQILCAFLLPEVREYNRCAAASWRKNPDGPLEKSEALKALESAREEAAFSIAWNVAYQVTLGREESRLIHSRLMAHAEEVVDRSYCCMNV